MSAGPLFSRQALRERIREADMQWELGVRAFDPFADRLRMLADGANAQARTLRAADLIDVAWKPLEDGRDIRLSVGLEAGGGREGPPELWAGFDQSVHALGEAMESNSGLQVAAAFEALRDAAREIADALDPLAHGPRDRAADAG